MPERFSLRVLFRAGVLPIGGTERARCETLRIRLGSEGISVRSGVRLSSWKRWNRSYSWSDVKGLDLHRHPHDRHDFTGLMITLPDRAITFQSDRIVCLRAGLPAREAIVGLWRRHVPESRIRGFAAYGPPRGEAERIERAEGSSRIAAFFGMSYRRLFLLFLTFSALWAFVLTILRGADIALERCLGRWLLMFTPMLMFTRLLADRSREVGAFWDSFPAIDA